MSSTCACALEVGGNVLQSQRQEGIDVLAQAQERYGRVFLQTASCVLRCRRPRCCTDEICSRLLRPLPSLPFFPALHAPHQAMAVANALPKEGAAAAGDATTTNVSSPGASAAPTGDLLILGAGTLGTLVAARWLAAASPPEGDDLPIRVVAETRTRGRHDRLAALGAVPRTRADADAAATASDASSDADGSTSSRYRFPFVLLSMPPSGSADDYAAEAARAVASWAGPAGGGRLIFTSSTSALAEKGGATITETAPTAPGRVTAAEEVILAAGGVVVRLGGLHARRIGGHKRFVGQPSVAMPRRLAINMVHYDDAAAAVVAVACLPPGAPTNVAGSPFVITDGVPLTVEELVAATMAHAAFAGISTPALPIDTGECGKRIDTTATREVLSWAPVHTYAGFWRGSCDDDVDA